MPRGKKQCPSCDRFVGLRTKKCSCDHVFIKKARKKPKPFAKERKAFIKRMLEGDRSDNMKLDMMAATKIFEEFDNDINFLSKVKPPFKLNRSLRFFLTEDGMKYLRQKKQEFDYIPPEDKEIVDHFEKCSEDIVRPKIKTLRDFLNNE